MSQVSILNYHFQRYGNFIGNYLDDISCAKLAGLHYVGVLQKFDREEDKSAFWRALPSLLPHENPSSSYEEAAKIVKEKCKCKRYCWDYGDPMMSNMPMVSTLVRQSVHAHMQTVDQYGVPLFVRPLELEEGVDMFPKSRQEMSLPVIPGGWS